MIIVIMIIIIKQSNDNNDDKDNNDDTKCVYVYVCMCIYIYMYIRICICIYTQPHHIILLVSYNKDNRARTDTLNASPAARDYYRYIMYDRYAHTYIYTICMR